MGAEKIEVKAFDSFEEDSVNLVSVPRRQEEKEIALLEKNISMWKVNSGVQLHLFDLSKTMYLSSEFLTISLKFAAELKKVDKYFGLFNVSAKLKKELREKGLDRGLPMFSSLEQAKQHAKLITKQPVKLTIDTTFISPFVEGAIKAVETQVGIKIKTNSIYLKKKEDPVSLDIVGFIAISCKEYTGSVMLCFSKDVFLKIYDTMLDEVFTEINDENKDLVGELMNIVFGHAKTVLKERGNALQSIIPATLVGDEVGNKIKVSETTLVVPFETEIGSFHMEFRLN